MVNWLSSLEYIKLFKNLKKTIPTIQKSQDAPENPESKVHAVEFLWDLKTLYAKIKDFKQVKIPHYEFLENLDRMPNDKTEFEKKVRENMLEIRNNKLCIKNTVGETEPIGDFSNHILNEIENWALAFLGTFKKS